MGLSVMTWITFVLLAIAMALNNIYSTLITGWGDGGSIIAVVLAVIFLSRKQGSIINYNLGQTMASAGGSVGFTTSILASIYIVNPGWKPDLFTLGILILSTSMLGVIVAIPVRKITVKWFFPSGVACATILKGVTGSDPKERKEALGIMGISSVISALLTLPTKISLSKGGAAMWSKISLPAGLGISLDPLFYGIGIVVGPRIGLSMIASILISTFVMVPELKDAGVKGVGDYVKWVAVGLMTLPAFASMWLAWKFKVRREVPKIFTPRELDEKDKFTGYELAALAAVTLASIAGATYSMNSLFDVGIGYVLAGFLIGGALCLMLGRVTGETDINPVRLLAIVLLVIFSAVAKHSPMALLAMGISGAALASVAVDLFQDLRTGYLIGARPKPQVLVQFCGVAVAAFAAVYFLDYLAGDYGFGEGKYFPSPGAVIWATMGKAFSEGTGSLPIGVWKAFGWASVVGLVLALMEAWPKTRRFAPSPFGAGIALLLGFDMCAAIFLGGMMRVIFVWLAEKKGANKDDAVGWCFQGGSAIFAAAAFTGIIAILLISLGVVHLPADH